MKHDLSTIVHQGLVGAFSLTRLFLLILLFTGNCEAQVWTSIGPTPLVAKANLGSSPSFNSGRVASIAVDPSDTYHWMVGFGNGGIWESRDAGQSWRPITDTAPTLTIGAVAFAPSDSRIVYAGTGEATGPGFTKAGLGMLKSTDGGDTWALVGATNLARAAVRRVRVHPSNPDIVLATASRGGFGRDSHEGVPSSPPFGVLRSINGGATWTRTLAGYATALEIDASTFNNQYAAIADPRLGVLNDSPESVTAGLYRSSDAGQTWAPIAGPWGVSSTTLAATGRIELAIAPSNPNVLYASIAVAPNGGPNAVPLLGLYRTDNAWAATPAWIQIPTTETGNGGYCGPEKCNYTNVISVDPSEPNMLFAGGGEGSDVGAFWRCENCGLAPSWTLLDARDGLHSDYHAIAWAGNRMIVGSDGGVWSTSDRGDSWDNHNATISTSMFFGGALHPTDPNFVLAGLRDFQVAVRNGSTWTTLPRFPTWGEADVALSTAHPDTDWMGASIWGAITRSTDGGRRNIQADAGIDKTGSAFVAPVRKCPADDDVFVTGTNRMWRTNNFFSSTAPSWVANGPPSAFPYPFPNALDYPGTIHEIEFSALDRVCNTYAYGTRGGQVKLTRNGGTTWTDLDSSKSLPPRPVNGLAFDGANPNILYAAISSFNNATPTKPGHVFKTTNAMADSPVWVNISPPDDVPYNVIVVDPRNSNSVYAGTDTGLWHSADGGSGWQRYGPSTGLPNASVYELKINPVTNRTVVFTYGRGAFSLDPATVPTGGPMLAITTKATLVQGATGSAFSQNLTAERGSPPYTWSLSSGALLPGLALSADGKISGTPTAVGSLTFAVVVKDAAGGVASQTITLNVISALPASAGNR